jgi:hypothetical protein
MSAKNWTACPRCVKRANDLKADDRARLKKKLARGTDWEPTDEVLGHLADEIRQAQQPPVVRDTLREDYALGINKDGMFEIVYRAKCQECSYTHEFKQSQPTKV